MSQVRIAKHFAFAAAHRLVRPDWDDEKNEKTFGKCFRLHGHNYGLTVELGGHLDVDTGMLLNYYELTDFVNHVIIDQWDHQFLNERFPFNTSKYALTTAENIAEAAGKMLREALPAEVYITMVEVRETDKSYARWIP